MKAWCVSTNWSDGWGIVFAETRNKARVEAMRTDACVNESYKDIIATRLVKLDGMENCEPKDDLWLNEDIRLILVRDYDWACIEPNEYEDCNKCSSKQYCRWHEE